MIEVLAPGPLATIQDLGRRGYAELGVGASGAADVASLTLANRLVGNPEGAAALELTFGGLVARFRQGAMAALTGAPCDATLDGKEQAMNAPFRPSAGATLRVGVPSLGVRTYLGVRGGIDAALVLGSRSTDTLAGLGPDRVARGMLLPIGHPVAAVPGVDVAPIHDPRPDAVLRVLLGPRDDWFAGDSLATFFRSGYTVSVDSDRVGLRLDGPALRRSVERELPSEGMVTGALQVPHDGRPVLFLADHPVTGGYPVLGVVVERDMPAAAQARPGSVLRFRRY